MDKRFQVFISSTFSGLNEQRKQAIEVVFERGHIPIALERFSPANNSDLQVIKKAIADCQIYILILGHKYGEIVPGKDISFTELEYNLAEKNGLIILPFLLNEDESNEFRKDLNPREIKDDKEIKNYDKLMKFRKRIGQFKKIWSKKDHEFKYHLGCALLENVASCNKPGFVREPEEPTTMSLLASASRNEFIVDIVDTLKSFNLLHERCSEDIEQKKVLSKQFSSFYLDKIISNKVSLFFESGSTVAYVARELSNTLSRVVQTDGSHVNIQISTNNVLAFLQLWFNSKIICNTFPWSAPTNDSYGALYGAIDKIEEKFPDYSCIEIDDVGKKEIEKLKNAEFTITTLKKPTLILATSSGLQISNNHLIKFKENVNESIKGIISNKISSCYGPHVGSYKNKIFKRFLYEIKIPIMFFITGNKIDREIEIGRCHFVHDSEFTWKEFYENYPVAFCVGCEQSECERYIELFKNIGFEVDKGIDYAIVTSFIAKNSSFKKEFDLITPI
jgi:hypothetical protein